MVCRWLKRRRKPAVTPHHTVPSFDRLSPHPQLIYRRYGTLTPTQRIAVHSLTAKRIKSSQDIQSSLPIGTAGTRSLLVQERREADRTLWRRFLGMDATGDRQIWTLTHTIYWGYTIRAYDIPKELLSASLNFTIDGYDADWVCRQCLEFIADHALRQRSYLSDDGSITLPPLLIQTSISTRINWLVLLYMRWRWLVIGR